MKRQVVRGIDTIRVVCLYTLSVIVGCSDPKPIVITSAPPDEARASQLLSANALQEAIWEFDKLGQQDRADSLSAELLSILKGKPHRIERWQGSGIMTSYVLSFEGGIRGFFKVASSDTSGPIQNELAAFAIDSLLHVNLTPIGAYRSIDTDQEGRLEGVVKYFLEDAATAEDLGLESEDKPDLLLFFDTIIANADRHTRNWMVRGDTKELIAIDHNRTFQFDQQWTWFRRMRTIRDPARLGKPLDLYRTLPESEFERVLSPHVSDEVIKQFLRSRKVIIRYLDGVINASTSSRPEVDIVQMLDLSLARHTLSEIHG